MKQTNEDLAVTTPANAMGGSSSTAGTGSIDIYDPLLQSKEKAKGKKKLSEILRRPVIS